MFSHLEPVSQSAEVALADDGAAEVHEREEVGGAVTLRADASDDRGVARVEFLVDGAVVGRDASAPYAFDWSPAAAPGATATIAARAVDVAGNEVAGHTLDHVRLTTATAEEQRRQVCDDRAALIQHGFDVRNFAYPVHVTDVQAPVVTLVAPVAGETVAG
jgi:peptidoglycan/xylan/chitin deacetylase (PgdA/CDA1 family)